MAGKITNKFDKRQNQKKSVKITSLKNYNSKNKQQDNSDSLKPGPFEMLYDQDGFSINYVTANESNPEFRCFSCPNYNSCLNIVAALDWEGFTCFGCNGEINQNLLWRAEGECCKDKTLQTICQLPDLKSRKIESEHNPDTLRQGLRLVVNKSSNKLRN